MIDRIKIIQAASLDELEKNVNEYKRPNGYEIAKIEFANFPTEHARRFYAVIDLEFVGLHEQ